MTAAAATSCSKQRPRSSGESLADPGTWATQMRVAVDFDGVGGMTLAAPLFNLTITHLGDRGARELLQPLHRCASPRFVTNVLASGSMLARVSGRDERAPTITRLATPIAFVDASVAPDTADGDAVSATEVLTGATLEANRRGIYRARARRPVQHPVPAAVLARRRCRRGRPHERARLLHAPARDAAGRPARGHRHRGRCDDASPTALTRSENAAFYFPRILAANPLRENRVEAYAPCGAVAGVLARTDASRGVWKTPAGLDATLNGAAAWPPS